MKRSFGYGIARDAMIRYVRFEILLARGEKYRVACSEAHIGPATVQRWRRKLGFKPKEEDGRRSRFHKAMDIPIRPSRYTYLRKAA